MTDLAAAFLADICACPADDTPRLVYADWLEDHGASWRAEFIRLQVGLDRATCLEGRSEAFLRERTLLEAHGTLWATPFASALQMFAWDHEGGQVGTGDEGPTWHWSRGFISTVCLPLVLWETCGAELLRAAPLEWVELIDKSPYVVALSHGGGAYWADLGGPGSTVTRRHALPAAIFHALPGGERSATGWVRYDTMSAANRALSDTLLILARGG